MTNRDAAQAPGNPRPAGDTTATAPGGTSARLWVARALTDPAQRFPDLDPPQLDPAGLTPADAALGLAIYRTTVQRWLTLEHLLDRFLTQKLRKLEPEMQAVLLSSAAQLIFLDRLPDYAVVDQAVGIAKKHVRPGAAGMVNAVVRKVARLVEGHAPDAPWAPARNALPLPGGGTLTLKQNALPDPGDFVSHISIATSTPRPLIKHWLERLDQDAVTALCLHAIENLPTVVVVEDGFDVQSPSDDWMPHEQTGFVVWRGRREALADFLGQSPDRRVQDVASVASCASTRSLSPATVLDYCAGRGTKTRQLAQMHPGATVYATDTHPGRRGELAEATAAFENVKVIEPADAGSRQYDLVVLDVPCTNTGVLARRPGARYRYSQLTLGQLVGIQREIVTQAARWVRPGGHLLYCTCSTEKAENQNQAAKLTRATGGELIAEDAILPGGSGDSYTDGSYHALVRL